MMTDAYEEGKAARGAQIPRSANPYPHDMTKRTWARWYAGWDEADEAAQMDLIKVEREQGLRKD